MYKYWIGFPNWYGQFWIVYMSVLAKKISGNTDLHYNSGYGKKRLSVTGNSTAKNIKDDISKRGVRILVDSDNSRCCCLLLLLHCLLSTFQVFLAIWLMPWPTSTSKMDGGWYHSGGAINYTKAVICLLLNDAVICNTCLNKDWFITLGAHSANASRHCSIASNWKWNKEI